MLATHILNHTFQHCSNVCC